MRALSDMLRDAFAVIAELSSCDTPPKPLTAEEWWAKMAAAPEAARLLDALDHLARNVYGTESGLPRTAANMEALWQVAVTPALLYGGVAALNTRGEGAPRPPTANRSEALVVGGATARPPFVLVPELVRDNDKFAAVLRRLGYDMASGQVSRARPRAPGRLGRAR